MRSLLAMALVMFPLAVEAAAPPSPVAFLSFKKLMRRHHLPRLQGGLPETMGGDLARSGAIEVVPFAEVRGEVDWRDLYRRKTGYTVAEAVAIGKVVNAGSVVIATFEMPGGDVTITATLVRVADSKNLASSTAKGPLEEVLRVQDEVLRGLFGDLFTPRKRAAHHLKASRDDDLDTYRAYTSYTLGLTGSDTTRWGLLEKSLEEDPHFPYAQEKMVELEKKTARTANLAHQPRTTLDGELRRLLPIEDQTKNERHENAMELCGMLERTRITRELATIATRIYELRWPGDAEDNLRADGLYWLFKAHKAMHDTDAALATAQKYGAEFSSARFFNVLNREIRSIEREREKRDKKLAKLADQLARLEVRRIRKEQERCRAFYQNLQYLRAARECGLFARRYGKHADRSVVELTVRADWTRAQALYEAGQFREARAAAERLAAAHPEQARLLGLEYRLRTWPRE